jgi:hypothetical protein
MIFTDNRGKGSQYGRKALDLPYYRVAERSAGQEKEVRFEHSEVW